ncbi:MAG: hypothetical protein P8X57_11400 [Cyclobacteriaceae bacterium]
MNSTVPVFDTDEVMNLDPLLIERIDVVRRFYGYGPYRASGIVALYSYKQDLAGYELPANSIDLMYQAAQRYKKFYIPEHQPGDRGPLPDFRNQLYWNPRLLTGEDGTAQVNFSLPDNSGLFRIVVQGMMSNGRFGSTVSSFRIE